jgi:hypothetical protein
MDKFQDDSKGERDEFKSGNSRAQDMDIADVKGEGAKDSDSIKPKNPSRPRRRVENPDDSAQNKQREEEPSSPVQQPSSSGGAPRPRRRRAAADEADSGASGGGWMSLSTDTSKTAQLTIEQEDELVAPVAHNKVC